MRYGFVLADGDISPIPEMAAEAEVARWEARSVDEMRSRINQGPAKKRVEGDAGQMCRNQDSAP